MSLPSEHKALLFVGAIAVLGAGVRVVRAAAARGAPTVQPELEHQAGRADSSARAESDRGRSGGTRGRRAGRGGRQSSASSEHDITGDTTPRRRGPDAPSESTRRASRPPRPPRSPLEREGYVGTRLDLDVATAAQIDSLPGVTPAMARRIAADRAVRGPFLGMNGLRRVSGVGPRFVERIDSLVTFSGTVRQPSAADTVIPRARRRRRP